MKQILNSDWLFNFSSIVNRFKRELAKYVAINCGRLKVCEARLHRVARSCQSQAEGCQKPVMTGEGMMGPSKDRNDEQWLFSKVQTVDEKKKLLAKVATKALWQTHLYKLVPPLVLGRVVQAAG